MGAGPATSVLNKVMIEGLGIEALLSMQTAGHNAAHHAGVGQAALLGSRMAALYRCWSGRTPVDLVALTACLLRRHAGQDQPLGLACLDVSTAVATWGGHAYHSAGHHAEVVTNTAVLVELASGLGCPLSPRHVLLLLVAASAHDYRYAPGQAFKVRFAAERVAAEAMDHVARRRGVTPADRADITMLILATEPGSRRFLASAPVEDAPEPLQPLMFRPDLVPLAAMLSDADLLSSAGLTVRWHQVQRERLERELGHPISPADNAAFFDGVVGPGFLSGPGRHFTPNLVRIRAAAGLTAA